jgi:hypothetical protein
MNNAMTKDRPINWKILLCCGIFIWFVINLLQGIFMEIHEDEAYYALYGEHLAWGYFDHPPLVGLMTFLGSIFFSGNLGVRFFTVIASCLSLWVMWLIANGRPFDRLRDLNGLKAKVVEPVEIEIRRSQTPNYKNIFLFFTIACSIIMFNIYGFVTTPDASLILFSAFFLLVYQRYLEQNTWPKALLMGVTMALMIYSKYHAFLLLGLIVLSNLKLLKDGKFYVACLVALALLTPHIVWQFQADFPSFRYHLTQRNEPFRWSYFLEYLPNQLLIFNPFTFGAVVYVLCIDSRHHTGQRRNDMHSKLVFERGLKFILIGFFFFFWLMAFRGHVEPHWTVVCCIPAVVLLYQKALIDKKLNRYIQHFVLPSLLLVVAVRVALLTPLANRFGFNGKKDYYQAIEKVADGHPVVFRGSFQQPALYHYFTGKGSSALCGYYDRKTQYDLWQFDTAWVGKPVFICGPVLDLSKVYDEGDTRFEGFLMNRFQSPNRLVTKFKVTNFEDDKPMILHHGDTIQMDFAIYNPYGQPFDFQNNEMSVGIVAQYLSTDDFSYCFYDESIVIPPHSVYKGQLYSIVSGKLKLGKNHLTLGIGDRVSSFITEENYLEVTIVGE